MIIGFLRSPRWKTPVMSFIDEYCTVFDDEEENKLEFTKIHMVSGQFQFKESVGFQKNCRGFVARIDEGIGGIKRTVCRGLYKGW